MIGREILPDGAAVAAHAADRWQKLADDAIFQRGRADIVLSGGSTPRALYELLAQPARAEKLDWSRLHLWFGDERNVPPDHPDSNYRMVKEALLDRLPSPPTVHRIAGERDAADAATAYEAELREAFSGEWPAFDLVLLGMGGDGHTASLFPGTTALTETTRWVTSAFVPHLATHRITLTFPAINHAAEVLFLIVGADKAARLAEVLGPPSTAPLPAARIRAQAQTTFLLDAAAASQLHSPAET